jgi:hypothetical protein
VAEDSDPEQVYVEGKLLSSVSAAFDEHDRECSDAAYLVLLNPANFELLRWDEIYGLPVLPDDRVPPLRCRLVCGARGWAGAYNGDPVVWVNGFPFVVVESEEPQPAT